MNPLNPIPMDQKTMEAAVALGEAIRIERGRYGVSAYLKGLADCMPHEWVREVAKRLEQPCPPAPPPPPPFDPTPGPIPPISPMPPMPAPPEPRQKQPDMEKMLKLMQLMNSLK